MLRGVCLIISLLAFGVLVNVIKLTRENVREGKQHDAQIYAKERQMYDSTEALKWSREQIIAAAEKQLNAGNFRYTKIDTPRTVNGVKDA